MYFFLRKKPVVVRRLAGSAAKHLSGQGNFFLARVYPCDTLAAHSNKEAHSA